MPYLLWNRPGPQGMPVDTGNPDARRGKQPGACIDCATGIAVCSGIAGGIAVGSIDPPGLLDEFNGGAAQPFDNDRQFQFII